MSGPMSDLLRPEYTIKEPGSADIAASLPVFGVGLISVVSEQDDWNTIIRERDINKTIELANLETARISKLSLPPVL